jgi:transcriptional regulator with XRE-family HTH domain
MKLGEWLEREGVSIDDFGSRIDRSKEAVRRYVNGERIPDRETMPKIARETGGAVTANDFFDISASCCQEDAPSAEGAPTGQSDEMSGASGDHRTHGPESAIDDDLPCQERAA